MNGFPFPISQLAEATLCGTALVVLLLLLRPILRRWLGARVVHALWLIALVRLLVPWTPPTPLAWRSAPAPSAIRPDSVTMRAYVVADQSDPHITRSTARSERPFREATFWSVRTALLIWLLGAALVFSLSLAAAWRAAPMLKRAREVGAESTAKRALESLGVPIGRLRIFETDELQSPALCGWRRPAILLPPGWAEASSAHELRCVLLHEVGHYRRWDVLWRWTFLVARAVHWFNPLVWLAERKMRFDQEMACDEWVLAHADDLDPQSYGRVLLQACRALTSPRITAPAHATMAESSAGLAQRIRHIAQMRTHGWKALAAGMLVGGIFFAIGPSRIAAQSSPSGSEAAPAQPAAPAVPEVPSAPPPPTPATSPAAASTPAAVTKSPLIEIETKFLELPAKTLKDLEKVLPGAVDASGGLQIESILEADRFQATILSLNKIKGVDLLSAPRATTRSGERAVVEVIREFRYPTEMKPRNDGTGGVAPSAFGVRNTGVTLEVVPVIEPGGRIGLQLDPSVVEFAGFVNYGAQPPRMTLKGDVLAEMLKGSFTKNVINQPIFDTRRISTSASIKAGQTILVGGLSRTDTQKVEEESRGHKKRTYQEKIETYLFIFVTPRVVDGGLGS